MLLSIITKQFSQANKFYCKNSHKIDNKDLLLYNTCQNVFLCNA